VIDRWEDTSAGRRLVWARVDAVSAVYGPTGPSDEVIAWVREQRGRKIRVATIQRMAKQIFGCDLADKQIRSIR
jgi:hypothetical protein